VLVAAPVILLSVDHLARHTAIRNEYLARYEPRLVRQQKGCECGDIFGFSDPLLFLTILHMESIFI